MRVVLVGPAHPHRGGIAQYTASLFRALDRRHQVRLISFKRQYPDLFFPGQTQQDHSKSPLHVPCEPLLDSISPASWRETADRVCDYAPDLLIFQWWQPFFAPAYRAVIRSVRRARNTSVIFLCHNIVSHRESLVPGRGGVERYLTRSVFRCVDGFLVQAASLVPVVQELNPNGVVRKVYHPLYDFYSQWDGGSTEIARPDPSGLPSLLFFGKIRRYKGLETFLRALSLVRKKMAFRAVIAGEFYMAARPYHRLARRLGLEECLEWRDHYIPNEEVPAFFRTADLVVLPYVEATQSGVVPVAYQFGVPVVASDVGGLSEVVLEGKTGYLVPPLDPEALAERILRYFQEGRRREFQRNILEFRTQLSWDQVVEAIEELGKLLR
jgi:glycosyltransferase involved in cell wall biosynthesis